MKSRQKTMEASNAQGPRNTRPASPPLSMPSRQTSVLNGVEGGPVDLSRDGAPENRDCSTNAAAEQTVSLSQEAIATRAHSLWQQSGQPAGRDLEIWLQAERELQNERQAQSR